MKNYGSVGLGRPLLAALTLLGSSALTVLPAAPAHAADYFTSRLNCVLNGTLESCWYKFGDAVKAATSNQITDAPDVAPFVDSAAWNTLRARMEQANPQLSAMLFSDVNRRGNGTLIIAKGGCQAVNRSIDMHSYFARNDPNVPDYYPYVGVNLNEVDWGYFDNKVNSAVGLNKCAIATAQDANFTGGYMNAVASPNSLASRFGANGVTSLRFFHNPTITEAAKACDDTARHKRESYYAWEATKWAERDATCVHSSPVKSLASGATLRSDRTIYNCTLDNLTDTIWVERSVTNSETFQNETGQLVRLEAGFGDLKTGLELTVKQVHGRTISDTSTVKAQTTMTVRPSYKGWFNLTPKLERYKVTTAVTYPNGGPKISVPYTLEYTVPSGETDYKGGIAAATDEMNSTDRSLQCN